MRFRIVVLALAVVAFAIGWTPASAAAHTTIIEPIGSHFPYQRWVDESAVPTPDVSMEVIEEPAGVGCPSLAKEVIGQFPACTDTHKHIWIGAEEIEGVHPREIFMHEVGHDFDALDMTEWARERFEALYNLPGPWFYSEQEWNSPGEWFATAYAECSVAPYITQREWEGGYAPVVYGGQPIFFRRVAHNKTCRMLKAL